MVCAPSKILSHGLPMILVIENLINDVITKGYVRLLLFLLQVK